MNDQSHSHHAARIGRHSPNAASKLALRAVIALACVPWCAGVSAQSFPTKPVRIIASVPPGGPVDLVARLTATKLSEAYGGRSFVVENRAGAAGMIGADYVAKSAPDGYTLLIASPSTLAISPALHPNPPYDALRDFAPISTSTVAAFMLVVHPSLPARSVKELVAFARSKPGVLDYASSGAGSFTHLSMELFNSMAKTKIVHIPFSGAAPAALDVMSGRVHMMVNSVATTVPFLKQGKLRGLAVTDAKRSAYLPDLPTMSEAGVTGYEATNWFGLVARAGTPREVIVSLNAALTKGFSTPDMKEKLLSQGLEPLLTTPENFDKVIRDEITKWAKVVKDSGAKVD